MTDRGFDAVVARAAEAVSRRISLAALGAAALGALGAAAPARAGKNGETARKRCTRQRGPCQAFIRQGCGDSEECLAARLLCCGILADCKFTAFVQCFDGAGQTEDRRSTARAEGLLR